MPGTRAGALKASITRRKKYGSDYFIRLQRLSIKKRAEKPQGFSRSKYDRGGLDGPARARVAANTRWARYREEKESLQTTKSTPAKPANS